eukprot:2531053-Pyramimonas_sp.AAC.1
MSMRSRLTPSSPRTSCTARVSQEEAYRGCSKMKYRPLLCWKRAISTHRVRSRRPAVTDLCHAIGSTR